MKFSTKAIHAGYIRNKIDGAIIPPLHLTTTFEFKNEGGTDDPSLTKTENLKWKKTKFNNDYTHYDYSRTANPTRIILEQAIAKLDNNTFGLAYSSGSAVLANIVALLKPNEQILFSTDAYGGTYRFIVRVAGNQGIGYKIEDLTDQDKAEKALKSNNVKIVWVESPTNPLLKVTDIEKLAKLSHRHDSILVVDNTFASPIFQQPQAWGADVVVYSTTKYINGHSDTVGGALTTSDEKLYLQLKFLQNSIGAILSPFDSWLTLRGLKTLELRMQRHGENAEKIAKFLNKHPKIKKVYYPGFFTGKQGKIVKKQMKHPGGMVSFEIDPLYDEKQFIKSLELIPLAESLGGVESLLDHPVSMTHSSIPKEEREKIGLSDGIFRLSVGIENSEDLLADIEQALSSMKKRR